MNFLDKTGLSYFWSKIKDNISKNYNKLDGSNKYVALTGGNGNTNGYRLVLTKNLGSGGTWNNCSMILQIASRNSGTGILSIDMRLSGGLDKFTEDTRFFGSTLASTSNLRWKQYYNSETGMYYLFWNFTDYNTCNVTVLQQRTMSNSLPKNGEWIEGTLDESIYGKEYPIRVNKADTATKATQDSNGTNIRDNYLRKSSDYLNTHPENSGTIIPFMNNDISFLTQRGGTVKVYFDGVEQSLDTLKLFDASASYWGINPSSPSITTLTIELTLHKTFGWTNTLYVDHGSPSWRAKNVKIEVMNTGYADDVWTKKYENTNLSNGNLFAKFSHKPVGGTSEGNGFNKVRYTFSNFANATIFRIAQLGLLLPDSLGLRETYMSRGIDDTLYRNLRPNFNNKYTIGTSTNKWKEVHATSFKGNADTATKLATARKINGVSFDGTADINFAEATTSTAGLMSASDKTKLDGLSNYGLPVASANRLGGIRAGNDVKISSTGVLNVDRVTGLNYSADTGKLSVSSCMNGEAIVGTTLDIHEGYSTTAEIDEKIANISNVSTTMPIIKSGSKVISATNSNGAQLFSKAEMQTLFGVSSLDVNKVSGCVVNGDTSAWSGNFIGLRIATSNGNIYAHLDQTVSGTVNMRCNYTLFYNK